jgi:hypothetical protein
MLMLERIEWRVELVEPGKNWTRAISASTSAGIEDGS